jgi:outer membrane receptor protein involved in Fe transport
MHHALRLSATFLGVLAVPLPVHGQRPDTTARRDSAAAADSLARHPLSRVVISAARLASENDARLPQRVVPIEPARAPQGVNAAAEVLQRLPGVSVSNDQGSRAQPTLDLRGFSLSPVVGVAQGISVFLDGVRVNEPDAQEVNFDLLPMEAIEHAQLTPGASAVLGKNTLGGSLDLRTARGHAVPDLRGEVTVGSYGVRAAHLLASGTWDGIDGLALLKGSADDGYQSFSGGTTRQSFLTLGRTTDQADAAVSLLYANDRIYEAGSLPESWLGVAPRANYTGGDFFHPELTQLSLRASQARGNARVRASLFARRNAIEQFNVNVGSADTRAFIDNRSIGATVEATLATRLAGRLLDLTLGAEGTWSRVGYDVFAESRDPASLPTDCDASPDGRSALCERARVDGDDVGAYAQGILQLSDRLSLLLSVRGDHTRVPFRDLRDPTSDGTNVFARLSPKTGITYLVRHTLRLYGSVGSAFRVPAALELACASPQASCPLPFALGADPPLRPVVAWNYELGTDWSPRPGVDLSLSLFRVNVRDEIVFVSADRASGYFQNVDRTRRDGADLSFAIPLRAGSRVFGSYSFVDATYRSPVALASALGDNVAVPGSRFALSPRHRASLGAGATRVTRTGVLDASLTARAISASYLRGDEANRMPPLPGYVVADAQLRAQRGRVSASVFAANLFDRHYAVFGVYATNPKGPYGGQPPAIPSVERFLTPAYPRTITLSAAIER